MKAKDLIIYAGAVACCALGYYFGHKTGHREGWNGGIDACVDLVNTRSVNVPVHGLRVRDFMTEVGIEKNLKQGNADLLEKRVGEIMFWFAEDEKSI